VKALQIEWLHHILYIQCEGDRDEKMGSTVSGASTVGTAAVEAIAG
jgi:hypothetical protein